MNTPNIGWLYYKDYLRINNDPVQLFQDAPREKGESRDEYFDQHFSKKNIEIFSPPFNAAIADHLQMVIPNLKNRFKTKYPGLTLGTGYAHETGELGEFKLGFFFDHTTGYPCIPGSTVKGCLRGLFPQKERENVADKPEKYNYLVSVIRELPNLKEGFILENDLGEECDQQLSKKREQFIDFLERELFDGEKPEQNEDGSFKMKDGKFVYQPICVYERDIFFDAYLVSTDHPAIHRSLFNNEHPFLADDYITPHINRKKPELSPFTNPVPLMFLKILPEVTIQFQFDAKSGLLTKEQKEELFSRLLLDFGIGAKTNVGYGQFEPNDEVQNENVAKKIIKLNQDIKFKDLKVGDVIDARIIDLSSAIMVELDIQEIPFKPRLLGISPKGFSLNQEIKVRIDQIGKQMKFSYFSSEQHS